MKKADATITGVSFFYFISFLHFVRLQWRGGKRGKRSSFIGTPAGGHPCPATCKKNETASKVAVSGRSSEVDA
jgi:hypothetical protein